MRTVYSLLYISLNASSDERVSIGVLMSDGEQNIFRHSTEKLLAIKSLIQPEVYNFLKSYLKSLESDLHHKDEILFEKKSLKNNWLTDSYMRYLSQYSNNLIQFSEPKYIEVDFSSSNFKRIFEKYVYRFEQDSEIMLTNSVYTDVKTLLYPKVVNRVNWDVILDATHFENLFTPIEVSFIGINGIPVAGQTIDFSKRHYNLENDVARYVSLTKAIEIDRGKGHYFVLGREPNVENQKSHLLWEQIRDSDFLDFIDINDVGIVENYIVENNVQPYFD